VSPLGLLSLLKSDLAKQINAAPSPASDQRLAEAVKLMNALKAKKQEKTDSISAASQKQVLALEAESDRLANMPVPSPSSPAGELQKAGETFASLSYNWRRKNNAHRLSAAKAAHAENVLADSKMKDGLDKVRQSEDGLRFSEDGSPKPRSRRGSSFSRIANVAARFSPRRNRSKSGKEELLFPEEDETNDEGVRKVSEIAAAAALATTGEQEAAKSDPEAGASKVMETADAGTTSASEVVGPSAPIEEKSAPEQQQQQTGKKKKKKKKKGKGR
jgi:hypothetical protein